MKIKLKRFLALVAAAATALSFAGCVSNNGGTPSDDDSSDGPEIIGGENHTHSWSSVYESDAEGHWKECSDCDEKAEEAAHTFGNWQVEKAATESEGGREYRECTLCGYAEYRDTAAIPHEHVWATTWSSDGDYHWYKCENCEEVSQKAAHTWDDGEVTTEPTETTNGIRTYTCETCHKTKTPLRLSGTPTVPLKNGQATALSTGMHVRAAMKRSARKTIHIKTAFAPSAASRILTTSLPTSMLPVPNGNPTTTSTGRNASAAKNSISRTTHGTAAK